MYVVSGSEVKGFTGPSMASDIFKSSHLSLDLTFTHRLAKALGPVVKTVTLVDVPV